MIEAQVEGVEFIAVNTDLQSLQQSQRATSRCTSAARSRAASAPGSNPTLGRQAAIEEYDSIKALLKGADMVFITAGAGGGTGTGAAPVVARIAREVGALTVGIVTKPFALRGRRAAASRPRSASRSSRAEVDTLIDDPELAAAHGARQADVDGRGVPRGRRRAAPGRAGHLRPDHAAGPDQPRLRRRAHDHVRGRPGAARHRHGHGRDARDRRRSSTRSSRRCSRPRSRARGRSCCRSPAAATCRCGRSTRPRRRWPRPPIRTPTSSSARWSTRRSRTRSGSRSWPPATATSPPRAARARPARPTRTRRRCRAARGGPGGAARTRRARRGHRRSRLSTT